MTNAFDLFIQGEYLQGLMEVWTSLTSEAFVVFMALGMFCVLVWAVSDSAAMAAMMFLIISGVLVTSHLTNFGNVYGLIPSEFQWVVLLAIVLAFGGLMWLAITRRTD